MLIIDPAQAAAAIGVNCGGRAPGAEDRLLTEVIALLLPRIEDALNVASLVRGSFVDHFEIPRTVTRGSTQRHLRLRNGFLVPDSVTIAQTGTTDPVDPEQIRLDMELGIVTLRAVRGGEFSVSYDSGFEPSALPDPVPDGFDPNRRVLQDVPDFIHGIAVTMLVQWFRTTLQSPKVPDGVALSALLDGIQRQVYNRVYGRYLRPRAGVIWAD